MELNTLSDVIVDLETLAGWAEEMRRTFADLEAGTVLVPSTSTWKQDPMRSTPPIIRPPRTTTCHGCIPETKPTVKAEDLVGALDRMREWLLSMRRDLAIVTGSSV